MTDKIKIKVKKTHPDAVIPKQAYDTDVGYDVYAIDDGKVVKAKSSELFNAEYLSYIEYDTGLVVEPPKGYHIELFPRSSLSDYSMILCNSIGLIDPTYRGNLKFRFRPAVTTTSPNKIIFPAKRYLKGDKIGQIVVRKSLHAEFEEVQEVEETVRGKGGFGSSGK